EEGLLTILEGNPVAECIVTDPNGKSTTEFCQITYGVGPYSVGCMVLWKGSTVMKQGCYSRQVLMLEQCESRKCVSTIPARFKPYNFCCCFGKKCNKEFS
ncbi:hypothetical protein PFISCL1PPCAC_25160, partial [Pristionchus fissidentatus]